jgi:phosphatidylglycerophosphate synthase
MDVLLAAGDAAVWGAVLGLLAVALIVLTWRTAHPTGDPPRDLDGYFDGWRDTHDGYDPRSGSLWVRGWLISVYRFARPLARAGISPDVLTLWTIWLALAVVVLAAAGDSWPVLAGWLVVFGGLADSLDGAVAVLTGRATRWGYVLDSAVDRCNDVLFAAALVVVGAPLALALVYVLLLFELEYIRARAGNAGGSPIGVITVGERANRVVFSAAGLIVAGLFPAAAARAVTVALAVLAVLSAVGVGQLVVAVRKELRLPASSSGAAPSGGADQVGHDGRGQGDQGHPAARM